jgi:AcrR family transcriptional regulator
MAEHAQALSPDRIVAAALALVEQDGWDALSMRRLAQQLDVWPMAVYRHFRDKGDLTEAVVAAAAARMELPRPEGWRQRLRAMLLEARVALAAAPSAQLLDTPAGARITAAAHEALRDAGWDDPDVERVWRALLGYTIGYPDFEGDDPNQFTFGLDLLLRAVEDPSPLARR